MKQFGVRLCQALRCKPCLALRTDKDCDEAEARLCERRVVFRTTLPDRLPHRRARPNDFPRRLSLYSVLRALPQDSNQVGWQSETVRSLTLESNSRQKTERHFCPHVQMLWRWLWLRSSLPGVEVVGHRPEILRAH